jgi:hypothetical protein
MAGLVPAIHVLARVRKKDVDARDKPGHDEINSPDIAQHRLDGLALLGGQRRLGCDGIADIVALDRKPGLDAGRQIVPRENFVDAP